MTHLNFRGSFPRESNAQLCPSLSTGSPNHKHGMGQSLFGGAPRRPLHFCCLLSMSNCFRKILTHHQIHRHSTAFSSPQRERRPRCHLRKLTRSCDVLGMGRKIYRSRNVWIICGKAFHVSLQNLQRCTSEDELVPTREMCEEFMMFQDQSLLYSALENHPISTCKWLGTQPLVTFWQLWFSRVYLPSKSMSGLGEISSIRFINITLVRLTTLSPPCSSPNGLT